MSRPVYKTKTPRTTVALPTREVVVSAGFTVYINEDEGLVVIGAHKFRTHRLYEIPRFYRDDSGIAYIEIDGEKYFYRITLYFDKAVVEFTRNGADTPAYDYEKDMNAEEFVQFVVKELLPDYQVNQAAAEP